MTVQTIDNMDKLNQESSEQFRGKWSVIREKKGKISSSRILLLLWGIGLFVVWSFVSLVNRNIAEYRIYARNDQVLFVKKVT